MNFSRSRLRQIVRSAYHRIRQTEAPQFEGKPIPKISSLSEIPKRVGDATVVSLDLFDTLVERTVEPPEYVKARSARFLSAWLGANGIECSAATLIETRASEEHQLRQLALGQGMDHECSLAAILEATVRAVVPERLQNEAAETWIDFELEAELSHLRAKPAAKAALEALKAAGKRVFVLSDMYLHGEHLRQILDSTGLLPWVDEIYSSADHTSGKYSGRLFKVVMEEHRLSAADLVHFGDNPVSDVIAPLRLGIRAFWLFEAPGRAHRQRIGEKMGRPDLRTLRELGAFPLLVDASASPLFRIGHDVMGPAFGLFALTVLDDAVASQATDLFFLAREGQTFYDLTRKIVDQVPRFKRLARAEFHYLYLSRQSTAVAAIHEIGMDEWAAAFHRDKHSTIGQFLAQLGIDSREVPDVLADSPIGSAEEAADWLGRVNDSEPGRNLKVRAAKERAQLRRYLVAHGFFRPGAKFLVDIGWNGTIQINLLRAFGRDADWPNPVGAYLGRHYPPTYERYASQLQIRKGYVIDAKSNSVADAALSSLAPVIETAATAEHGTTLGYQEEDGKVVPILEAPPASLSSEAARELRVGVAKFLDDFVTRYAAFEYDPSLIREEVLAQMERIALKPTIAEVREIARLSHELNWGDAGSVTVLNPAVRPWSILRPLQLQKKMDASIWPRGTWTLLGPARHLYNPLLRGISFVRRRILRLSAKL